LVILIGARVLVGVVPPDEAASGCAEGAMVTRTVTRCTTNNGSPDASFGRRGEGQCCKREKRGSQNGRGSH